MARPSREEVASVVDHTLLKPEATPADVTALGAEAAELGVYAVCVSPSMVAIAKSSVPTGMHIASVVGFPSGKHLSAIKATEAAQAVAAGADEIDMVIDVGAAVSGDLDAVRTDIAAVRAAVPDAVLKVIVESAALLNLAGEQALAAVCRVAADEGADFVKTSTGFHPSGGATTRAVELMADAVGPGVGVKASGGIRTADDAVAMLAAGATRLGLSGTRAVLDGLARLEPREAGVVVACRDRRVLGRKACRHTGIGDLNVVGLDAQRVVLGQLRGEGVQGGLHHLARQGEAEPLRLTICSASPPSCTVGLVVMLPSAASSSMVPSDGFVLTPVTKLPTSGMAFCTVCFDAVGRPGDRRVQRADRALRVPAALQPHVVDVDLGLHALGVADLVARGLDRDVAVVPGHVLQQER